MGSSGGVKRRFLYHRIRRGKMKGSGLREDREKAMRDGQRTSDLNSEPGNAVEGERRDGQHSGVRDLKAREGRAVSTTQCEKWLHDCHTPV